MCLFRAIIYSLIIIKSWERPNKCYVPQNHDNDSYETILIISSDLTSSLTSPIIRQVAPQEEELNSSERSAKLFSTICTKHCMYLMCMSLNRVIIGTYFLFHSSYFKMTTQRSAPWQHMDSIVVNSSV